MQVFPCEHTGKEECLVEASKKKPNIEEQFFGLKNESDLKGGQERGQQAKQQQRGAAVDHGL